VAVTADGGRTWSAAALPAGVGPLHALACPTPARCLAVGTSSPNLAGITPAHSVAVSSTDGGRTWSAAGAPPGIGDAVAVACPTTRRCTAVGTAWTGTAPPAPVGAVATTNDGGATWREPAGPRLATGLVAVACPTATDCVAGGGDLLAGLSLPAPRR
jgi:photosystem II stability/assembly factor-like uncharacterized protein